jgi:hypothetical protein
VISSRRNRLERSHASDVQAVIVLVLAGAAWFFVPDEYYAPLAVSLLVLAAAGVLGIKAYLKGLHANGASEASVRTRQSLAVKAGVFLAVIGLSAFVALIVAYAD